MRFSREKLANACNRAITLARKTGRLHYLYLDSTGTHFIVGTRDPRLMEPYFAFAPSNYAEIDLGVWTRKDYSTITTSPFTREPHPYGQQNNT